jgi:hypothetical protein
MKITAYRLSGDALNANRSIGKEDSSRKQKININNLENDSQIIMFGLFITSFSFFEFACRAG